MTTAIALIVAAGRGHRVGGPLPKQYRLLDGRAVLDHSVRRFATHSAIDGVRVVIHPDDRVLYDDAVRESAEALGKRLLPPVGGGASRQESVRLGLESLADRQPDAVLIHDGARPLVPDAVIDDALAALGDYAGAIAALPVSDTLKRADIGTETVAETVAREGLWRAQTPQVFRYDAILEAHRAAAGDALTDDAAVAERGGLRVALTTGDENNLKITTEADFDRAARILDASPGGARDSEVARMSHETRVGTGFDVHRFGPGDHVMLCGVAVPHAQGVVSHSDGDVALHALVDALLGAVSEGDIGTHFPPSDEAWRDAESARFVSHAMDLLAERGATLSNVDLTIICERPKVGPHRAAMVERLATLLAIGADRISLKATTTERLGFTGRGEGIAAQAVAAVRLPLDAVDGG